MKNFYRKSFRSKLKEDNRKIYYNEKRQDHVNLPGRSVRGEMINDSREPQLDIQLLFNSFNKKSGMAGIISKFSEIGIIRGFHFFVMFIYNFC